MPKRKSSQEHGQADSSQNLERLGRADERTQVTILKGETIWCLAAMKYDGRHPIHAIFEANDLLPQAIERNGRKELLEPIYHADTTYVFPALHEVEALEIKYRRRLEALDLDRSDNLERLGPPSEERAVCLRPDETFWKLSEQKYNGKHHIQAIFEANGLMQNVVNKGGKQQLQDPIYYAGKSYIFPAESEIEDLTKRYQSRINALLQDAKNI